MKTKKEILQGRYVIVTDDGKEVVFNQETPKRTAHKILELYQKGQRIVLNYGDITTGVSWGETHDTTGRIGMSKGFYDLRWPILVHNTRSMGGAGILTPCILDIRTSRGKNLIFKHK